ncbi:hypothetical protein LCGC14_0263610, partial [marine sediment metagenome]
MKINVTLHSSIPTETGAWLKVGLDVLELDTEQDIEAQTSEALETWIKVTRKLNDGMLEQVEAMLIDPDSNPEGETATAYMAMVDTLIVRRKKGSKDIEMIVLDTIDELIEIFLRDFCLKHKLEDPLDYKSGEGNAYSIVRRDVFGILDRAYKAGFGWTVLAHVTPKTIRHGGEDRIVMSLSVSDSFRNAIFRKCEHMMFMDWHTITTR